MATLVSWTVYCGDAQNRHAVPPTESIYQASNRYLKACLTNVRKNPRDGHRHGIIRLFIFTGLQKYFANNKPPFHQSLSAVTTKINWSRHGSNIQPSHIVEKKKHILIQIFDWIFLYYHRHRDLVLTQYLEAILCGITENVHRIESLLS